MMNKRQTYYFIGKLLSTGRQPGYRESLIQSFKSPDFNWSGLIALGSNHLVLQTIYCRIIEEKFTEYIPFEVLAHLKYINDLNYRRNTEIIQQVNAINLSLNDKGIIPLYMKGAGNILDGLYGDTADRLMHDIDILVPDEHWELSAQILIQEGYQEAFKYDPGKREKTKHYPPLYKPGTKVAVEIHRLPVDYEYLKVLGTKEVWDRKKLINSKGACYVMCDRHKVVMNFVHTQLADNGYAYARVLLRNMYDLLLLARREDITEDFAGINNYHKQAEGYVRIMQKVFGIKYEKRSGWNIRSRIFSTRHEINIRSRLISSITFFTAFLFRTYIKIPIRSLTDRDLRNSSLKKLFDRNWYKRHYKSLTRFYIRKSSISV